MAIEIRCPNCRKTFPSPVDWDHGGGFDGTGSVSIDVPCPHCGKRTGGIGKEAMRGTFDKGGGGFTGEDSLP